MNRLTDREVVENYGQIYDNVKHMKQFIKRLHAQYKKDNEVIKINV